MSESLWFNPDPPSITDEEERALEEQDWWEEFGEGYLASLDEEFLRSAPELHGSADNQRPTAWEPPQELITDETIYAARIGSKP
jgi:hypothetical protein